MSKSIRNCPKITMGLTFGLIWAFTILGLTYYPAISEGVFGVVHGQMALDLLVDVYPYFTGETFLNTLLGMAIGFVDAFILGLLGAWLYNALLCKK